MKHIGLVVTLAVIIGLMIAFAQDINSMLTSFYYGWSDWVRLCIVVALTIVGAYINGYRDGRKAKD